MSENKWGYEKIHQSFLTHFQKQFMKMEDSSLSVIKHPSAGCFVDTVYL